MFVVIAALFGLIIGSAINAIVWRLYTDRSWVRGRSMCPECKHELAAKDLIPVISWVALRGQCRYCKTKIHWQYPVVELLTAVLFGLSAATMNPTTPLASVLALLWFVILTMLIILAVYDARWMILPDKIMYPTIVLGAIYLALLAVDLHTVAVLWGPLIAAFATGALFYGIATFSGGRAMGGGDIKLVFVMGLLLGIKGTLLALLLAFNVAAIVGITMIVGHKKRRNDHIPFGPYLIGALIFVHLYGQAIINWYWQINGL